jgi:hypothetical protein
MTTGNSSPLMRASDPRPPKARAAVIRSSAPLATRGRVRAAAAAQAIFRNREIQRELPLQRRLDAAQVHRVRKGDDVRRVENAGASLS